MKAQRHYRIFFVYRQCEGAMMAGKGLPVVLPRQLGSHL